MNKEVKEIIELLEEQRTNTKEVNEQIKLAGSYFLIALVVICLTIAYCYSV